MSKELHLLQESDLWQHPIRNNEFSRYFLSRPRDAVERFCCAYLAGSDRDYCAAGAAMGKLVDVGGYRVHLYCTGTGSSAVVIVGAGYSFNWGLVQPEVARFTQVCTYDHSGIAWSDSGPKDSCDLRVGEVHTALKKAGIAGPYVLVGHSLGALVSRLYAADYPDEVAGIVFVDHAMILESPPGDEKAPAPMPFPPPATPGASAPTPPGGIENDPNFTKLSSHHTARVRVRSLQAKRPLFHRLPAPAPLAPESWAC